MFLFPNATWKKIQATSGLAFGCFLVLHLTTHYSNIVSQAFGQEVMAVTRKIYQNPILEVCLFVAAFVHMGANAVVMWHRSKVQDQPVAISKKTDGDHQGSSKKPATTTAAVIPGSLELKAHRYAGYFLSIFFFGHVFATRWAPLMAFGLQDASNVMNNYLQIYFASQDFGPAFVVYVMLLGMTGTWHLIYGTRSALATLKGSSVLGSEFPMPLKVVALYGHILIINAVLAMVGLHHYDLVITNENRETQAAVNKVMGL